MSYIGRTIGGKYKIVRKVGSGGMGSVYAAEKVTTHELFALKFMNRELITDETYVERFKREIASLNAIRHPNVVNVFDWYLPSPDSEDLPYILMELLDGEGLDELLARKSRLSPTDTIAIMLQVLDGLAAAHEIGVIHRDLGTTNVFLFNHPDGKRHVKLLDFGLAKPLQSGEQHANITKEGTVIGKAAFAAPEIFHGEKLAERSDIFACGMMMMRMLTGGLPYKESSTHLLWVERYSERENPSDYAPPSSFNPDIPPALDALVSRAVKKKPSERFKGAREMQAELLKIEAEIGEIVEETEEISSADLDVSASALKAKEMLRRQSLPGEPQQGVPPGTGEATSAISSFDVIETKDTGKSKTMFIVAAAVAVFILFAAALAVFLPGLLSNDRPVSEKEMKEQSVSAAKSEGRKSDESRNLSGGPEVKEKENEKEEGVKKEASPETVHIVIVGAPENAVVKIENTILEGNPPEGSIPRGEEDISLEVMAKGYKPYSKTISPTRDIVQTIAMQKIAEKGKDKTEKKKGKLIKGRMGTSIKTAYED